MARVFVDPGVSEERDPIAECSPSLDIIETQRGLEILVDVPGVAASAIEITLEGNTLVIAGDKRAPACEHDGAGFHLAERAFGQFARAVAIDGAYDAGTASATLAHGELRIVLPRIDDRRGRRIRIPVRS